MMILLDVDIDNVFDDSGESSPFASQTLMTMILLDIGDVVDDIAR